MNNNAAAGLIGFMCLLGIGVLVAGIFYLVTLQTALGRCARRNRTMEPGLVWLSITPLVHFVWWV